MNRLEETHVIRTRPVPGLFGRSLSFYVEGFCVMTVGKKLWAVILVKLFIMFFIFKLFLFPDILSRDYDNDHDRAQAVRTNLTRP